MCIGRLKKYVIAALKCFVASILNAGQPEFLSLPLGWFGALRRGSWEKLLFVCREDKIVVYRMTRRLIGCKRHSQDTHAASEREKKKKGKYNKTRETRCRYGKQTAERSSVPNGRWNLAERDKKKKKKKRIDKTLEEKRYDKKKRVLLYFEVRVDFSGYYVQLHLPVRLYILVEKERERAYRRRLALEMCTQY